MRLTRLLSTSRERARAKAVGWLLDSSRDHGGLELPEANAILTTLDKTPGLQPSVKALKSLGVAGLAQLRDAVATDMAATAAKREGKAEVLLCVEIPHERTRFELRAFEGQTIKEVADDFPELAEHMQLSCGGIGACSTCHVIVHADDFERLPPPGDAELDMVDLALGVTPTSRLGCQLALPASCDGGDSTLRIALPSEIVDHYT
jgi:ferredoxin|tara:strand:- start:529 stop:1143 length:615 start_codon:yes stop_codon:yes gene_type:complete